jgi:hypothetical protein
MAETGEAQARPGGEQPQIGPSDLTFINAPTFYVDGTSVSVPLNDAVIVFVRGKPATLPNIASNQLAFVAEPTAIVQMSVRTLKDLHLSISIEIEKYEKEFGKIETNFTRQQTG